MELLIYWLIAYVVFTILYALGTWNLYVKAGRKSWEAAIPLYNLWIGLKIIQRPKWWIIFFFVPIVMPVFWLIYWVDFARCFGKRDWTSGILMVITLGLYVYYLNYIEKPEYTGPEERKSTLISSLLFAIVLATLVHNWFIQPMIVPTGSMENTIRIGDALFVEKISYGARIPLTPLGIPYAEFINRKAYVNKARLPYMRLPGWKKLKSNDIVVFNYPTDTAFHAVDRKDAYVKRLVGLPGETIEVKNKVLLVDGKEFIPKKDALVQHKYKIISKSPFSEKLLYDDFDLIYSNNPNVTDYYQIQGDPNLYTYEFKALTEEHVQKLKNNPNVVNIEMRVNPIGEKTERIRYGNQIDSTYTIFPVNKNWNEDNYGPLYIPKKGDVVEINENTLPQYINIIRKYEGNDLKVSDGKIFINGKESKQYTISQDYFFMMGDNRNQSLDSRFFGYVPEDHIIGQPFLVWANANGMFEPAPNKFIWKRFFTSINNDNPNKKSYGIYVLIALIAFFGWDYYRVNKKKKESDK